MFAYIMLDDSTVSVQRLIDRSWLESYLLEGGFEVLFCVDGAAKSGSINIFNYLYLALADSNNFQLLRSETDIPHWAHFSCCRILKIDGLSNLLELRGVVCV